jgi:putative peptide modification system cyclase
MKRKPDTTLDRAIASEIAIRDGARAVILPTVAEVGGRVRVSAEVIDPHTQTTVYAESADGLGAESTLGSIDAVTGELREKLGEAIASIERDSAPLPQVSTDNLDALKAYALGTTAYASGDSDSAEAFYRQALALDPKFALALAALGSMQIGEFRTAEGKQALEAAAKMREHLTPRELLRVEATLARFGPVPELLKTYQRLSDMYPDMLWARMMYAQDGWMQANQFAPMVAHAKAASATQNPHHAMSQYLLGILYLGDDEYAKAVAAFEASRKAGFAGAGAMYARAFEAQRKYADADRIYAARGGSGNNQADLSVLEYELISAVDRGDFTKARALVEQGIPVAGKDDNFIDAATWRLWSVNLDAATGEVRPEVLREQLEWIDEHGAELDRVAQVSQDFRIAIGYLAAREGQAAVLDAALKGMPKEAVLRLRPMSWQGDQVLRAEQSRLAGNPGEAIDRLYPIATRNDALAMVHSALARSYGAAGRHGPARREANWLANHRGRVFVERGTSSLLDPINVADSTLAWLDIAAWSKAAGDEKSAKSAAEQFARAWPAETLPRPLRERVKEL